LLFQALLDDLRESVVRKLFFFQLPTPEQARAQIEAERRRREEMEHRMRMIHSSSGGQPEAQAIQPARTLNEQKARLEAQKRARRRARK
jgi:hypothetical protein